MCTARPRSARGCTDARTIAHTTHRYAGRFPSSKAAWVAKVPTPTLDDALGFATPVLDALSGDASWPLEGSAAEVNPGSALSFAWRVTEPEAGGRQLIISRIAATRLKDRDGRPPKPVAGTVSEAKRSAGRRDGVHTQVHTALAPQAPPAGPFLPAPPPGISRGEAFWISGAARKVELRGAGLRALTLGAKPAKPASRPEPERAARSDFSPFDAPPLARSPSLGPPKPKPKNASDPYVRFKVGYQTVDTEVMWDTLEPHWPESTLIKIPMLAEVTLPIVLRAEVWDSDKPQPKPSRRANARRPPPPPPAAYAQQ